MTQRAMEQRFYLAEIVPEQSEHSWSPPSLLASRLTIRPTSRNSLGLSLLSFQPKTKLRPSRLQTILRLDSEGRSTPPILRGPSASPAASRQEWSLSTIRT